MNVPIPRGLGLVGLGFLGLQLSLGPWRLAPSWDEAIYLSQVAPGPALPFAASRSRGIVALVAPLAAPDLPLPVIRVAIAAAATIALVLAFLTWSRVVGDAAVWAAAACASGWPVLLSGSAVMPNLWFALICVALVGATIRAERDGGGWIAAVLALAVAAALFRPFDAVVLAVPLLAWSAARRHVGVVASVLAGIVLGIAPWLVEMSVRFGGIGAALDEAAREGHVGTTGQVDLAERLALLHGPLSGSSGGVSLPAVGWFVVVVALAASGVVAARKRRGSVGLAAVGAVALASAYLVLVDAPTTRFFLPALALAALPVGVALERASRNARLVPVVGLVAVAWIATNGALAWRLADQAEDDRSFLRTAGAAVRERAGADPCVVRGYSWPQIAYEAGCGGVRHAVAPAAVEQALGDGARVFVARPGSERSDPLGDPVFVHPRVVVEEVRPEPG